MNSFQQTSLSDCHIISIPTFTDERGCITIAEEPQITFVCKRVFWLHHINKGKDRGSHALKTSSEIMIAIHGSFVVELSDGRKSINITLNSPTMGLFIPPGVWFRTHSFNSEGICLVLASDVYSKEEYILDYKEFINLK